MLFHSLSQLKKGPNMKNSIYDMIGALLVALTIPVMMVVGIIADAIFNLV